MTQPADIGPVAIEYGRFDFGLSHDQEDRAEQLHDTSVIVDLQWQGPGSPDVWTTELAAELDQELAARSDDFMFVFRFLSQKAVRQDFPLYKELYDLSGVTTGLSESILSDERELLADAFLASQTVNSLPWARRARTAADIRAAKSAHEIAFWGLCSINFIRPDDLHLVEVAHELGVMDVVELAYNQMTFIGAGCTERYDPGLSHFGLQFVRRCNEVGVIVDTAHTGRQTTLDACQASSNPVIATHTSAAALYECDRAKSDEELRAIADTGGIIGVYAIPFFLAPPGGPPPTIELMLDHVDYVVQLVGWPHVALGPDWPIALPEAVQRRVLMPVFESLGFRDEHNIDVTATLIGFRDPRDIRNIVRGLVSRGYDDQQIRGILGENFLRVFEDVCG